jgi:hypothetical protein
MNILRPLKIKSELPLHAQMVFEFLAAFLKRKINGMFLLASLNPFISITPSKPLMSSGSWLTLHTCEIFYLLAVDYDPPTTDLIFIRANIYPGSEEGGSQLIS